MERGGPIEDAANSADADARLHGQTAQSLVAAGNAIIGFGEQIGTNGSVGEIDIETARTIIEVTTASAQMAASARSTSKPPGRSSK